MNTKQMPLWAIEALESFLRELRINLSSHKRCDLRISFIPGVRQKVEFSIDRDRPAPLKENDLQYLEKKVLPQLQPRIQEGFLNMIHGDLGDVKLSPYSLPAELNRRLKELGEPFELIAIGHTIATRKRCGPRHTTKYAFGRIE